MTYSITIFGDRFAASKAEHPTTFEGLVDWLQNPPEVGSKAECALFSQTRFGDKLTENGSYRSADNAIEVFGAELDYDGEVMSPREAHERLTAAGIRHFVYTSASHRPEAPRWRVVVPFEGPQPVEARRVAVEKCNTILGGVLSSESFTLSQPFYVGRVKGVEYETYTNVGGLSPLQLEIERTPWKGARGDNGSYRVPTDVLLDDLRAGVEIHPAIVALAARGYSAEELIDVVERNCAGWPRPERAEVAIREDIPRAVGSWERKKTREIERQLAAIPAPPPYVRIEPPKPPGMFARVGDITAKARPLNWLIRDRLEHPSFVVLFGPPEQGKTFVAIDMACSVALGRDWQGGKTKRSRVHYLAGEGHNGLGRRFLAWKLHNEVSDAEWNAAELYVSPYAINMLDDETMQRLYAEVQKTGTPELLFIDTYTRMTPGLDQSSQKEVGEFVRRIDDIVKAWNCTVVILQHTGQDNQHRAMGSIVLKGAVDVEMRVMKTPGGEVELSNTKSKEAPRFPDQFFRFQDVTLPWLENEDAGPNEVPRAQRSAVLVSVDAPPPDKGGRPHKGIDLLREVLREGPLPETEARTRFRGLTEGTAEAARKQFNRALERAVEAGLIVLLEDGRYKLVTPGGDLSAFPTPPPAV